MARDKSRRESSDNCRRNNGGFSRRSYLKLAGATAGTALSATALNAAANTTNTEIAFNTTVNVVDDLGVDPTGTEPVEDAIVQAAAPGTKFVFPEGTYLFSKRTTVDATGGTLGFVGNGSVNFTVPEGFNDYFLIQYADKILFRDIDIDIDKPNTATGFKPYSDRGLHIENVEFLGRGVHSESIVPFACTPVVRQSGYTGLVKNLVAKKGSAWGHYKSGGGRCGIWVGKETAGTIRIVDADLREFGNNAIYASRTYGNVQVEGGYFLNNNAASVRISGQGSYVDGATIEIDPAKYAGPEVTSEDSWYLTPIRIEQAELGPDYKPGGMEIRNCDITVKSVGTTAIPILILPTGRTTTIQNVEIHLEDSSSAIRREAKEVQSGIYQPPDGERWIKMDGVRITETSPSGVGVRIEDAPGSEITNCCIKSTGSDRDGIRLISSDSSTIADSVVDVTGTAIDLVDTQATTSNISQDGACPTQESTTTTTTTTDTAGTVLELVSDANASNATYEFTVDGTAERRTSAESSDTITDNGDGTVTISGVAGLGYGDSFLVDGSFVSMSLNETEWTIRYDGQEVTVADLTLPGKIIIDGTVAGGSTTYEFDVDGQIGKSALLGSINADDTISDGTIQGSVKDDIDGYRFSGDIDRMLIDGSASVDFVDNDG